MSQSLDLADPVTTILGIITTNFSEIPVTVISGFTRGGYTKPWPRFIPVEGEVREGRYYPRKGKTDLSSVPGKAEVLVYEVSDSGDVALQNLNYGDREILVSIDIYHKRSRDLIRLLYHEIVRCLYLKKKTPGGGYHHYNLREKRDLSNRKAGFWRFVQDIEMVTVGTWIGHI